MLFCAIGKGLWDIAPNFGIHLISVMHMKKIYKLRYTTLTVLTALCLLSGIVSTVREVIAPAAHIVEEGMPLVIVDAGHGGLDGGTSAKGVLEKDLNLQIAKRLELLLLKEGIRVVMTRTEGEALTYEGKSGKSEDLRARLELTRRYPDAILVSIHINQFPVSRYSGSQIFYPKGDKTSQQLAQLIQDAIREGLQPDNDREIKPTNGEIYLLDRTEIPAVLVECGFLSNPGEFMLLQSEDYQQLLAGCIANAVKCYYNGYNGMFTPESIPPFE